MNNGDWREHPSGLALVPASSPDIDETTPAVDEHEMSIRWDDWFDLWMAGLERLSWFGDMVLTEPWRIPPWFTRENRACLIQLISCTQLPTFPSNDGLGLGNVGWLDTEHPLPLQTAIGNNADLIWRPCSLDNPSLLTDGTTPTTCDVYVGLGTSEFDSSVFRIEQAPPNPSTLTRPHGRLLPFRCGLDINGIMPIQPQTPFYRTQDDSQPPSYDDPHTVVACTDDWISISEPFDTHGINSVAFSPYVENQQRTVRTCRAQLTDQQPSIYMDDSSLFGLLRTMDSTATVTTSTIAPHTENGNRYLYGNIYMSAYQRADGSAVDVSIQSELETLTIGNIANLPAIDWFERRTRIVRAELAVAITDMLIEFDPISARGDYSMFGAYANAPLAIRTATHAVFGLGSEFWDTITMPNGHNLDEAQTVINSTPSSRYVAVNAHLNGVYPTVHVLSTDINDIRTRSHTLTMPTTFMTFGRAMGMMVARKPTVPYPQTRLVMMCGLRARITAQPIISLEYEPIYPRIKRRRNRSTP